MRIPCIPLMSNAQWRRWVGAHPGRVYPQRGPCDTASAVAHAGATPGATVAKGVAIAGGIAGSVGAAALGSVIGWYLPGYIASQIGPGGSLLPRVPFVQQPPACCIVATPPQKHVSVPEPSSALILALPLVLLVMIVGRRR